MVRRVTSSLSTLQHLATGIMSPTNPLSQSNSPEGILQAYTAAEDYRTKSGVSATLPLNQVSRTVEVGYSHQVRNLFNLGSEPLTHPEPDHIATESLL
jgi:hypothetical protein